MSDCRQYQEMISAAIDGELSQAENAELCAHLEQCEVCRRYYEVLKELSGILQEESEVPEGFAAFVMSALPAGKKKPDLRRWAGLAAAVVLVAGLAGLAGRVFAPGRESGSIDYAMSAADCAEPEMAVYMAEPAEAPAAAEETAEEAAPEADGAENGAMRLDAAAGSGDFAAAAGEAARAYISTALAELEVEILDLYTPQIVPVETAVAFEPCLEAYVPVGSSYAVSFATAESGELVLLVDEAAVVYGKLLRE